jgi:hypothetical protein
MLLIAAFLTGSGCETPKQEEDATPAKPLVFPTPSPVPGAGKGKWTPMSRQGGTEHILVLGDMEDVISFYGFSHPVAATVRSFEDLEALMRADTTLGFRSLQRGDILGVPVLWFEKEATEKGAGSESLASSLGARPRQADGTYIIRTRGVFLLQKGMPPRFVTIACARTSTHGQIGPVYEARFRDWLTTIISNCFL